MKRLRKHLPENSRNAYRETNPQMIARKLTVLVAQNVNDEK